MSSHDCARAEITAGAVALGEATDAERDSYRRHLSVCRRCLECLGGERDVERTMQLVARARDAESWQPDIRVALRDRTLAKQRGWRFGRNPEASAADLGRPATRRPSLGEAAGVRTRGAVVSRQERTVGRRRASRSFAARRAFSRRPTNGGECASASAARGVDRRFAPGCPEPRRPPAGRRRRNRPSSIGDCLLRERRRNDGFRSYR